MKKARIGIIGVGWWGTVGHLEPLADDPKTELVAVWSRTESKAKQRAERYGVPRYYTDYRKMIDECDLDGVIVASTPNMHYEQARYALEHDLHVLVEKPFVLEAAHANTLQRLAQERGVLLTVCHPLLYSRLMIEARQEIRRGTLGRILLVSALFSQRVYELYKGQVPQRLQQHRRAGDVIAPNPSSYSDPAIVGGGEGHTQASHIIGMILWLTGLQPASVFAYMNNVDAQVDVVDAMAIRFSDGALASVAANGLVPPRTWGVQLQVQGDEGTLRFEPTSRSIWIHTGEEKGPRKIELQSAEEYYHTRAAVPKNFIRAILGEEELHVEMEVAVNEARILAAAYRSAASGQQAPIER